MSNHLPPDDPQSNVEWSEQQVLKYARRFMEDDGVETHQTKQLDDAVQVMINDYETILIALLGGEEDVCDSLKYFEPSWNTLSGQNPVSLHTKLALSVKHPDFAKDQRSQPTELGPWTKRGAGAGVHYSGRFADEKLDVYEDNTDHVVLTMLMLGVFIAKLESCAWKRGDASHLENGTMHC